MVILLLDLLEQKDVFADSVDNASESLLHLIKVLLFNANLLLHFLKLLCSVATVSANLLDFIFKKFE